MIVVLVCQSCGDRKEVNDQDGYEGLPVLEWWEKVGKHCRTCREKAALPDPTAPQLGKFGAGHPETSRRAAVLAYPRSGSQRAAILDAMAHRLSEGQPEGLTAYEASAIIGRSPNQTATRMLELREQGWIRHNGQERATTPGNTGLVHVFTDDGRRQWLGPRA